MRLFCLLYQWMSSCLLIGAFQVFVFVPLAEAKWEKTKDDQLKLEIGPSIPRYNFRLVPTRGNESVVAEFEPNAPSKTGVSLAYRNLAIGFSLLNPPEEESIQNYGKSSAFDFQFRFYGKRTYEFFYQSYRGYFIQNSAELDSSFSGQPNRIQKENLKTSNYGLNFFWNLHEDDFSKAVAFDQSGRQQSSAWGLSWLLQDRKSVV